MGAVIFNITTLNIKGLIVTLSIKPHDALIVMMKVSLYRMSHFLIVMLNVIMLNVIMLNVVM